MACHQRAHNRGGAGTHSGAHGNLILDLQFESLRLAPPAQRLLHGARDEVVSAGAHAIDVNTLVAHHGLFIRSRRHVQIKVKADGDGAAVE